MGRLAAIVKENVLIIALVGMAFFLDIFGAFSSFMPNTSYGTPSLLVVIYSFTISLFIRLVLARRRIHLAIVWPVILFLYFGWFVAFAFISDGETYTPSLLFILCLVSSFRILRYEEKMEVQNTASEHEPKIRKMLFAFKPLSKYTRLFICLTLGWFIWVVFRTNFHGDIIGIFFMQWDDDLLAINIILPPVIVFIIYKLYRWINTTDQ